MGRHIIEEAKRCLLCKKPLCKAGCPVSTSIPEMIKMFLDGDVKEAGEMLFNNNPLSIVCSLICPHENFCEGNCVLAKKGSPVQISSIENYISTYYLDRAEMKPDRKKGAKVAVIGSGPAGITVAFILALKGYDITIFESEDKIGGVLRYGIPEYRLPKNTIDKIWTMFINMGVKIRPNILIGPVVTIDNLFRDGYRAVFIGTGVWSPKPLRIEGESLGNVHFAINYLKNPDVYNLGKRVCVIGAGNVAMDVARTALRKNSEEVTVVYRRGEEDVPATKYEVEYAKIDGVVFEYYRSPVRIIDNGVIFRKMAKIVSEDGTVTLEEIPGSDELFEADSVIIAASQSARSNIVSSTEGLSTNKFGLVITDECGRTTKEGVFASGDVVTGAKTVVEAVNYSKKTACAIEDFIKEKYGIGEGCCVL